LVNGGSSSQSVKTLKVTLGTRGDSLVEVKTGLKAGDLVIVGLAGDVPAPVEFGPPRGTSNNGR